MMMIMMMIIIIIIILCVRVFSVADDKCLLNWLERPMAKPRPRWRVDIRRIGCGVD